VSQSQGLRVGESQLKFVSKTIQTHNSSHYRSKCYWRLNEVIPQNFKVNDL